MPRSLLPTFLALACFAPAAVADLVEDLRGAESRVLPDRRAELAMTLSRDVRARRDAANRRDLQLWQAIQSKADWERFRDERLAALRRSLGQFLAPRNELAAHVTGGLDGEGHRIENVVFESCPGLWVTANLYLPAKPTKGMPGILICHSHHNPKEEGELQDMGVTWARQGCAVLVMDQVGHGERRQHPFRTAADYPGSFRPGRQDYYFRYITGMQLHLVGESLIGWMARDLMTGVDLLLQRGADPERIALLGAVAGGGDPAAVTGALDKRITAVGPFNFGGPQPETKYPLPDDAETSFNYAGGGSWESTRNLRLSARDGFLPWVIVGSVAPRGLIYGHEFSWDKPRDPVWKRLEKIYGWYGAEDRLTAAVGKGLLSGRPPEASHCNNIGPLHRQGIYPAFQKWFRIDPPKEESRDRRKADELRCMTSDTTEKLKPKKVHELAGALADEQIAAARRRLEKLTPDERRKTLRAEWAKLLGDVEPKAATKATTGEASRLDGATVERVALEVEPGVTVPLLVLVPRDARGPLPVVVGVAQGGKDGFLKQRSAVLAELLNGGVAVCLADVRGTGETRPDDGSRGRTSSATSISATEAMLGQTLLGSRLRDLRSVLAYLRTRKDLDAKRLALWGDSLAPVNAADRRTDVPLDAELPDHAEPLGGLLALFGGLFEEVQAVYGRGGLVSYRAVLESPFCYVPHDALVPGATTAGDLSDVASSLAPRPVRLDGLVDGLNRAVSEDAARKAYGTSVETARHLGLAAWLRSELDR